MKQAKLTGNIILVTKLLAGSYLASLTTRWEIMLPTHAESVKNTTIFEVVDGDMGYSMIIEVMNTRDEGCSLGISTIAEILYERKDRVDKMRPIGGKGYKYGYRFQ